MALRPIPTPTSGLGIMCLGTMREACVATFGMTMKVLVPAFFIALFISPALISYTLATGARPSAVRACIMAIIYFFAPLIGRKADTTSTISAAALLILLWAPSQLHDPGFIFSFVVVSGIVLLYPLFNTPLQKIWERDPFIIEKEKKTARTLRSAGRYISGLAALSISAWLSSAPLTAYYFGRITHAALLSNLFVIPAALAIVFTGSLSIVIGACCILPGIALNHLNAALVSILTGMILPVSKLPLAEFSIKKPGIASVILCYSLIFLPAIILRTRSHKARKNNSSS